MTNWWVAYTVWIHWTKGWFTSQVGWSKMVQYFIILLRIMHNWKFMNYLVLKFSVYVIFNFLIFIFTLFYFTMLYWFCHTLTWIRHGCTWVLNPEPPSHLRPHIISLDHPSGSSPCTSPKHPISCIEPRLAIHFLHDSIHISMPFSQIIPPSPSPTEYKSPFYTSVSLLLSCIEGYHYHLSKFHIYVLVYFKNVLT